MPSGLPPNVIRPNPINPLLPDWIPPTQDNNPSAGDINDISNTLSERILTVSPWGRYVPVIFGEELIGGILTLVQIDSGFLYMRLVWCVGEIEEIVSVEFEDGTTPDGVVFTHYTGTSGQTADATLSALVAGYSDTLEDIGADGYNLAYTVVKVPVDSLAGFPRFIARIKGLKMLSPVPKTTDTKLTAASETDVDILTFVGNVITITDNTDGIIGQFIRYNEDELINSDTYNFTIEVTAISGIGSGDVLVQWCGGSLIDDITSLQMNINAIGTYTGTASFTPYDATNNFIRFDVTGANIGVSITYEVTLYNATGNAVSSYSDIAGVALNHLITDTQIGLGATSDLTSLVDLINRNSSVLESGSFSESRSAIGLTLNKKAQLSKHIEVLRGYARCNISNTGGVFKYYPLQAQSVAFSLTVADIKPNSLKPVIKDARAIPNIVRVYYTDTYTTPWKDNFIEIETSEVTSGAEYKREAVYRMGGFQSRTAALRFGYDRINERLRKFTVSFRTHESCYDAREGETFNLTHPRLGATTYKMKLFAKKKINHSEWDIYAEHEDDTIYSNEIAGYDPSAGTISIDDPFTIVEATGLTLSVETPQYQTSIYFSRLRVVWTLSTYNYNHFYKLEFYEDATNLLLDTQTLNKGISTAVLNNIQENILYRVELSVIGFGGTESTGISDTITPTGKDFPPSDVPTFVHFESLGVLKLNWSASSDNEEIWYYTVQYGGSGFTWDSNETRVLQGRIDALELITTHIPEGTYDFLIKAVDNAGNQSTNATRISSVVIHDSAKEKVVKTGTMTVDFASSTGVVEYLSDRVHTITDISDVGLLSEFDYLTKNGQTWTAMFTSGMNTYTDPLITYGIGTASILYTNSIDYGKVITARWTVDTIAASQTNANYKVLGGEMVDILDYDNKPEISIQLSNDNSSWTSYLGRNITGEGRYMRIKIESSSNTDDWIFRDGFSSYIVTQPFYEQTFDVEHLEFSSDPTILFQSTYIDLDFIASEIIEVNYTVHTSNSNATIVNVLPANQAYNWLIDPEYIQPPFNIVELDVIQADGSQYGSAVQITGTVKYLKN